MLQREYYLREYYLLNKDKILKKQRTYDKTNKDKIQQRKKEYYKSHPEAILHRDKRRKDNREGIKNLATWYVVSHLKRIGILNPTEEMIQQKRLALKLKRTTNENKRKIKSL